MTHQGQEASALVLQAESHLAPGSLVLDLACGYGRNGLALARRGHQVWFADRNREALDAIQSRLSEERLNGVLWQTDLEAHERPLGQRRFDAILVCHYLHRPLLPDLALALRPGGILIYETFTTDNRAFGRPNNPAFLLEPNELKSAFASLETIHYREGIWRNPDRATAQLIARKAD
ncbi:class I SAM-dependent methyltransferase [Ferrimonas balearica]|uniref:class I SAM-dependent methyltransferase n=1 Tax=Ferrimonas balearica TaxID=44012 RepID=UPI001C99887F|nr:class I SAM-dependent methyltransferase [Ferrimonas balearica]MBY5922923.1 class I SAM-dependent methyltransferase [Ferrimonas balearica]MBY5997700.1 class I SAM-dependent methyltransferase [Ferrimonas balearica]